MCVGETEKFLGRDAEAFAFIAEEHARAEDQVGIGKEAAVKEDLGTKRVFEDLGAAEFGVWEYGGQFGGVEGDDGLSPGADAEVIGGEVGIFWDDGDDRLAIGTKEKNANMVCGAAGADGLEGDAAVEVGIHEFAESLEVSHESLLAGNN